MSVFSAQWLALRAAADHRACSPWLTDCGRAWASEHVVRTRRALHVVDLGSGTGSTVRRLAPVLPVDQRWLLVDHDLSLLGEATARTVAERPGLGNHSLSVDTRSADLAAIPLDALLNNADLVTASALFDLVSDRWCADFAQAVARPGRALLAQLTYDGRIGWSPPDADDEDIRVLVNRHQQSDKGFGTALGPAAAAALPSHLADAGATVHVADSTWHLSPDDQALSAELLAGWAEAAIAVEPAARSRVEAWRMRRCAQIPDADTRIAVGHVDVFACWP